MNILFIHEVDWIRKVVYDVHILAEAMSIRGHNVYAIDYESMWEKGVDSQKEVDVSRVFPEAIVHLIRPRFIKIVGLSRLSAFVSHYFAIKKVLKEKNIDAIVLYSVPTNGLQAVYLARKFNIPIVFRSLDVLNKLVAYSAFRPITKMLEKKVYSNVDMALTLTRKLSEYMVGLGAKEETTFVLPMSVDTNIFYPSTDGVDELREKWGLQDKKVVLFMGTLFNFSGLDDFIPQFKYVLKEFPEARLLIVGDGEQLQLLEGVIITAGLEGKVIITGFQPYQDMPKYINLADVCINTFEVNDITRDIFPGKTVQFLACGKPLVNTPLPGVISLIKGHKQGVLYVENAKEMARVAVGLLWNPEVIQKIGINGLNYVKQVHSCEKVAHQLETILEEAIKGKQNERVDL